MSTSNILDNNKGFAAGTLVHTDRGLVPIQDIKVGDMVLSMPEEGIGEKAYKRVLKTTKTPHQEVYRCTYWAREQYDEDEPNISYVLATADHPIWSITEGQWRPARGIEVGDKVFLLTNDNKQYHFLYANQLCQSHDSNGRIYGYCLRPLKELHEATTTRIDAFFEINDNYIYSYNEPYGNIYAPCLPGELDFKLQIELANIAEETPLLCDVYNIEVEDYHTYFVGEDRLWIHT